LETNKKSRPREKRRKNKNREGKKTPLAQSATGPEEGGENEGSLRPERYLSRKKMKTRKRKKNPQRGRKKKPPQDRERGKGEGRQWRFAAF